MDKTYLIHITLTPEEILELTEGISVKERIHRVGPTLEFDEHMFLVKSELSAPEIFNGINKDLPTILRMFIAEINPDIGNIYGFAEKEFWKFLGILKEKEDENK